MFLSIVGVKTGQFCESDWWTIPLIFCLVPLQTIAHWFLLADRLPLLDDKSDNASRMLSFAGMLKQLKLNMINFTASSM